jgi:pilus assembly protein CpaE
MSAFIMTPAPLPAAAGLNIQPRIVAFISDDISEAALRTALAGSASELVLRRGNLRNAVRFLEKDTAIQAILVDICGIDDPVSALEDLARVCPPDVTVLVIGDNADIAFYRLLVNDIGVAEYLPKPLTRDAVERLLLPHLEPDRIRQASMRGGHVVAVCGASGGAGSTTIAVNTAIELAESVKGNVVLLDLNLQHGAAALMLAARPGPGLRIALEDPDQADTLLLERAAIQIGQHMRLIAADESLDSGISISEPGVRQVMSLLQQKFNYIVVDLPMPLRPELHQVLTLARQVALVLKPDIASVRNARAIRQLATTLAGADRVITVLNCTDMAGGLPTAMVEKVLGISPKIRLPELGRKMPESVNLGVPAVKRVPQLRKHLAPLIREIAGIDTGRTSASMIRRLLGR